eukprot:8823701-Pyramimonas_sp.AAC.1
MRRTRRAGALVTRSGRRSPASAIIRRAIIAIVAIAARFRGKVVLGAARLERRPIDPQLFLRGFLQFNQKDVVGNPL